MLVSPGHQEPHPFRMGQAVGMRANFKGWWKIVSWRLPYFGEFKIFCLCFFVEIAGLGCGEEVGFSLVMKAKGGTFPPKF